MKNIRIFMPAMLSLMICYLILGCGNPTGGGGGGFGGRRSGDGGGGRGGSAPGVPTIITTTLSNIADITANVGGNISNNGGVPVTARGVCWSTSPNPTIADSKTSDGLGIGAFTSSLTGLTASTAYYARAYATNSLGTAYGNQVSFTTSSQIRLWEVGSGKTYSTIQAAIDALVAAQGMTPFTNTEIIRVYNGTYTGTTQVSWNTLAPNLNHRLIIESASGQTPQVDGKFVICSPYTTVRGFIINVAPIGIVYTNLTIPTPGGEVCNNIIKGGNYGLTVDFDVDGTVVIYNNIFINNVHVICSTSATGTVKIYNNTIYLNSSTAQVCMQFATNLSWCQSNVDIKNNIFMVDGLSGGNPKIIWDYVGQDWFPTEDYNTIYAINGACMYYDETSPAYHGFNDWKILTGQDAHSRAGNAKFKDITTNDFHLLAGSPCIDSATNLSSYFITDFDGNIRTVPWDMGAYKYLSH